MFVEKHSAFKEICLMLMAYLWAPPPSSDSIDHPPLLVTGLVQLHLRTLIIN